MVNSILNMDNFILNRDSLLDHPMLSRAYPSGHSIPNMDNLPDSLMDMARRSQESHMALNHNNTGPSSLMPAMATIPIRTMLPAIMVIRPTLTAIHHMDIMAIMDGQPPHDPDAAHISSQSPLLHSVCSAVSLLIGAICAVVLVLTLVTAGNTANQPADTFSAITLFTALTIAGLGGGSLGTYHGIMAILQRNRLNSKYRHCDSEIFVYPGLSSFSHSTSSSSPSA